MVDGKVDFRYVSRKRGLPFNHVKYLPVICSDASREQLESIKIGFDKCITKAMEHVQLDEHFLEFYNWAKSVSIPIVVLSGGLEPLITTTLQHFNIF